MFEGYEIPLRIWQHHCNSQIFESQTQTQIQSMSMNNVLNSNLLHFCSPQTFFHRPSKFISMYALKT